MAMQHTEPSYTNWEWGLTGSNSDHNFKPWGSSALWSKCNQAHKHYYPNSRHLFYISTRCHWLDTGKSLSKILLGSLSTYPLIYHLNSLPELRIIILYKEAEIQRSKKFGSPQRIEPRASGLSQQCTTTATTTGKPWIRPHNPICVYCTSGFEKHMNTVTLYW